MSIRFHVRRSVGVLCHGEQITLSSPFIARKTVSVAEPRMRDERGCNREDRQSLRLKCQMVRSNTDRLRSDTDRLGGSRPVGWVGEVLGQSVADPLSRQLRTRCHNCPQRPAQIILPVQSRPAVARLQSGSGQGPGFSRPFSPSTRRLVHKDAGWSRHRRAACRPWP